MNGSAAEHASKTVADLLDQARQQGRRIRFWWRDDDAVDATPALDRLLALTRRFDVPLALAVIPGGATDALAARLRGERGVAVLQHGWLHRQHNPPGAKKAELGPERPVAAAVAELRQGSQKLQDLFGAQFQPVLVPPWNRIAPSVAAMRDEAGLAGLSTYGRQAIADPHHVNTHLDIFRWKPVRVPLTPDDTFALLADELRHRPDGSDEPIGLLTHHLIHEEASWALLADLLALLARHPATVWPTVPDLFHLS